MLRPVSPVSNQGTWLNCRRLIERQNGQTLIEAAIGMPLLITLLITFLGLLYQQLWMQLTEHLLHEAIVCQETLGSQYCLTTANIKANRYNLFGTILIHSRSNDEIVAELFVFRKLVWKTLTIKKYVPQH